MKGSLAWIVFGIASLACLVWIGIGVGDELREKNVYEDGPARRNALAAVPGDTVRIGIVGDWKRHGGILRGAELAVRELNEDGGVLGSSVVLEVRDDGGMVDGAMRAAQDFADTPEIALVIGHTEQELNAATAGLYEAFGLLRLSPNCAGEAHTEKGNLLFGNGKPQEVTAGEITALARAKGWSSLGLVYDRNSMNMDLARRLEELAAEQGIRVPVSAVLGEGEAGVRVSVARWKRERGLDAVVLAVPESAFQTMVSDIREAGVDCPAVVVGGEAGSSGSPGGMDRVFFISRLREGRTWKSGSAQTYRACPGEDFSGETMKGYDAVYVLAETVEKAGSFVPSVIGKALQSRF